jgi:hypothetical protein
MLIDGKVIISAKNVQQQDIVAILVFWIWGWRAGYDMIILWKRRVLFILLFFCSFVIRNSVYLLYLPFREL